MHSMTGFGRAEALAGTYQVTIEVKSVNHRYLDLRFRLPPSLSLYESALAEMVRANFERGSFEIVIKQRPTGAVATAGGTRFTIDTGAAKSLREGCEWLQKNIGAAPTLSLEFLAMTGKVFLPVEEAIDSSTLFSAVRPILQKALEELRGMREAEGKRLKTILEEGVGELERLTSEVAKLAPLQPKKIQEKLSQKIQQWRIGNVDAQRLEWEIAFYAERSEITEEIDRLGAHASEFRRLLQTAPAPAKSKAKSVGRKLDFLTQELHREVNTMGAKAALLEITRLTVEGKTLIEKLREQVQNVE